MQLYILYIALYVVVVYAMSAVGSEYRSERQVLRQVFTLITVINGSYFQSMASTIRTVLNVEY